VWALRSWRTSRFDRASGARLALGFLDYKRPTAAEMLRLSGAIFDAVDVRVRELPITPLDEWGERQCK
jgi:hypothetical protein